MTENLIASTNEKVNLTVVTKKEKEQAKLIPLKAPIERPRILLPPQQEKYIKARKHDFL